MEHSGIRKWWFMKWWFSNGSKMYTSKYVCENLAHIFGKSADERARARHRGMEDVTESKYTSCLNILRSLIYEICC